MHHLALAMFPARSTALEDFEVLGRIGEGAFSEVHRARHRENGLIPVYYKIDRIWPRRYMQTTVVFRAAVFVKYFAGQVFTMKRVRLRDPTTGIHQNMSLLSLFFYTNLQSVPRAFAQNRCTFSNRPETNCATRSSMFKTIATRKRTAVCLFLVHKASFCDLVFNYPPDSYYICISKVIRLRAVVADHNAVILILDYMDTSLQQVGPPNLDRLGFDRIMTLQLVQSRMSRTEPKFCSAEYVCVCV